MVFRYRPGASGQVSLKDATVTSFPFWNCIPALLVPYGHRDAFGPVVGNHVSDGHFLTP